MWPTRSAVFLIFSLKLAVLTSVTEAADPVQGIENCQKYDAAQLDTSLCTEEMRNEAMQKNNVFDDIYSLLNDSMYTEDQQEYIILNMNWMYRYLHCSSESEAIAVLFYDKSAENIPSAFLLEADNYLKAGHPVGGALEDTELFLLDHIKNISRDMAPSCVQWLIGQFKAQAAVAFKKTHENFPDPNTFTTPSTPSPTTTPRPTTTTPTPTTTTPTPTTTTPEPTTTTPKPTTTTPKSTTTTPMPTTTTPEPTTTTPKPTTTTPNPTTTTPKPTTTTPKPTTTTPTPTTTTPKPTTTTPMTTTTKLTTTTTPFTTTISTTEATTKSPVKCWVCSGLDCLLYYSLNTCQSSLCLVTSYDGEHGRDIKRSCANDTICQGVHNDPSCEDVEDHILQWHTSCQFCCSEDECNEPPYIKPEKGTKEIRWAI